MKAILVDDQVLVYGSPEDESISIATIHKGEEMDLGKVSQKKKKTWVEVTMAGNQKGYISGSTKIFAIRKATIADKSVDLKDSPSESANTVKTLLKGAIVTVYGVEKTDETNWFKARDESNTEGFIPTSAKLRAQQELSQSSARRNIITGLIFVAIGIFLTVTNYNSAANQTMILISYAVIFFGLLQLGQGVWEDIRLRRSKDKPNN